MKIKDEKIQISVNGKITDTTHLNRGYPRVTYYFENADIAAELAQGKTKQQAKGEELRRTAITLFNSAISYINELSKLDAAAADAVIAEVYNGFMLGADSAPGGSTSLKSLEQRAAALFFLWQDAESAVSDRAGMDKANLLTNICFGIYNEYRNGNIKASARTREALRKYRDTQAKAEREAKRELSPEGRAILAALEDANRALEACADQGGPDEDERAEKIMEEAEAPLDALALNDPEEATRIYYRSSYFECESLDGDIYLGEGVFCRRDELQQLDTPEKRAAYIRSFDFPFNGSTGPSSAPAPIGSAGDAVTLE